MKRKLIGESPWPRRHQSRMTSSNWSCPRRTAASSSPDAGRAHHTAHCTCAKDWKRQYSPCGADPDADTWTIAVHRAPDSRGGSRGIHEELTAGDLVPVSGPRNTFPLEHHERYVFIAGGIGVTPILAMVRELRKRPGTDFTFLY
jgi:ferredoxin-NADP reductase